MSIVSSFFRFVSIRLVFKYIIMNNSVENFDREFHIRPKEKKKKKKNEENKDLLRWSILIHFQLR